MEKSMETIENGIATSEINESESYSVEQENNVHPFIQKIYNLNLPDYVTNRTINVLEKIIEGERVYAVKTDEYEEYISLVDGLITVTQKMIDYSGATANKRRFTIKSSELLDYVENNSRTVDASLGRGRRR